MVLPDHHTGTAIDAGAFALPHRGDHTPPKARNRLYKPRWASLKNLIPVCSIIMRLPVLSRFAKCGSSAHMPLPNCRSVFGRHKYLLQIALCHPAQH